MLRLAGLAGVPVAVDVRRSGQILYRRSFPGTPPETDNCIERKAPAVAQFEVSSHLLALRLAHAEFDLGAPTWSAEARHAAVGGAFPIRVANVGLVAVATVSGLRSAEDHELAVAALQSVLEEMSLS
jgi:uncharacterized protein (UPF0303 family)